jgi:hypothetical protein
MKHSNELIKKWRHIFGNDTENERNIALASEMTMIHLLDENYHLEIESYAFPIIFRIFREIKENLSITCICNNVSNILENLSNEITELKETKEWDRRISECHQPIDFEAEFTLDFSDRFTLILN